MRTQEQAAPQDPFVAGALFIGSRSSPRSRRSPSSSRCSTTPSGTSPVAEDNILRGALELLLIIANIGTAVVVYPIAGVADEILAIGYVAARMMESVFIAVGIICVLGTVRLRQDCPDAGALAVSLAASRTGRSCSAPEWSSPWGTG